MTKVAVRLGGLILTIWGGRGRRFYLSEKGYLTQKTTSFNPSIDQKEKPDNLTKSFFFGSDRIITEA